MHNFGQTIDLRELEKFEKDAAQWWDESGPQKALHHFNLVRTHFVKDLLATHFGKNPSARYPLEGLRILDAGCRWMMNFFAKKDIAFTRCLQAVSWCRGGTTWFLLLSI